MPKMYTRHGAFIQGAQHFDNTFFGISALEARTMEPPQRNILDVGYHSYLDAGLTKTQLLSSNTGVFVGTAPPDNWCGFVPTLPSFAATAIGGCIIAGRFSYVFGLHGPSLSVDTACSSAIVALDLARGKLRQAHCDTALAGSVQIFYRPGLYLPFSNANMLSRGGRCKSFDSSADGFARAEGSGAVVLAPSSTQHKPATSSSGSSVNQDGRSATLTAPNGPTQQAVIRSALREAGMAPADIDMSECHGTGTALGDPIEVGALSSVLASRERQYPKVLGTSKSNFAHLEAAAGSGGFIKCHMLVTLCAVPNIHLRILNPHLDYDRVGGIFPSDCLPWPTATVSCGVSSFGFGGTNAHAVLRGTKTRTTTPPPPSSPVSFVRRSYAWRHLSNPMLADAVHTNDGAFITTRPMSPVSMRLYSDHRVLGTIVLPGVNHLGLVAAALLE